MPFLNSFDREFNEMHIKLAVILTGMFLISSVQPGSAQERNYWVQLETHNTLDSALERARQVSADVRDLRGIRTEDGKFVLAVGLFEFSEARRIRIALANAGAIPVTSRVNGDIDVAGYFWPSGRSSPADGQAALPVAAFDEGEKLAFQTALSWFNEYTGEIDGIFGSGTREAIASFQENHGFAATGQLTRAQSALLLNLYNAETRKVRLEVFADEATGIRIEVPRTLVRFSGYNFPVAHFEPISEHGMTLYLLSMEGNQASLAAMRNLLLNSEFIPGERQQRIGRNQFRINGTDGATSSYAQAQLKGNRLKGFAANWNHEHDEVMQRIINAMQTSFHELHEGTLDPERTQEASEFTVELLSSLPRPMVRKSASGFFVDGTGRVATTASAVEQCDAIEVGAGEPMTVVAADPDLEVAILEPENTLRPISHAGTNDIGRSRGSRVTVSGYSYGGELGYPTATRGAWIGNDVVTGNPDLRLIEAPVLPGDAGGPVLDDSGNVLGMLRPPLAVDRTLPGEVHHLVAAPAVWRLAAVEPTTPSEPPGPDAVDIARHARDMTVLVRCFGSS